MITTRSVDTDVHATVPSIEALFPYMSDHWHNYLLENEFRAPNGLRFTFPSWSDNFATTSSETARTEIERNVLSRSNLALLHCYFGVESQRNPFFAAELALSINSWMKEHLLDADDRLYGSLVIAPQDTELAVQEIERVGDDPAFAAVYLPARSWEPYGNRRYWPIWEAAAKRDLALAIHLGGLARTSSTPFGQFVSFFEEYAAGPQLIQAQLASLISEGVFDKFPSLRVAVLESGVSWIPGFLWKLDPDWKSHRREVPWVRERPSEYLRRHVRFSAQPLDAPDDDVHLQAILDHIGSDDVLMFASDYPHDNGVSPERLSALLSDDQRVKFMYENAWECFGLEERTMRRNRIDSDKRDDPNSARTD